MRDLRTQMLKDDRLRTIINILDKNNVIQVSDLADNLKVTETTIRRDLSELEEKGLLVRVHGGAKKKTVHSYTELTHKEKQTINIEKKKHIAKICASLIEDHDVVFIGSGTTNDLIFDYVTAQHVNIVTNSINVFNRIKDNPNYEVVLSGGRFRKVTGTFVGYFSNKLLREVRVNKAFIGTNGINDENITTANEEEGNASRIILDNAKEKFILADSTKFGTQAFFTFYNATDVTAIITDPEISQNLEEYYNSISNILK